MPLTQVPLTQEETTQISEISYKLLFYQSFLKKNNIKMLELIKERGIGVCYFSAHSTSREYEGGNYDMPNLDPISRHAFLGDGKEDDPKKYNFNIDCCKNFLKILDHDQRIKIISSINLEAFLRIEKIKADVYWKSHLFTDLNEIVLEEYSDHTFENEDLKKKFVENALGQYLKPENISKDNPLYGGVSSNSEYNYVLNYQKKMVLYV
jgi:hypothetical protein